MPATSHWRHSLAQTLHPTGPALSGMLGLWVQVAAAALQPADALFGFLHHPDTPTTRSHPCLTPVPNQTGMPGASQPHSSLQLQPPCPLL
mmetsp:Transcript_18314/g.46242  ORF Transcript_18314/g.46242 Transcript_18314/m.46242 type:complete len:90 (-) Transcript_18314:102-371(-)